MYRITVTISSEPDTFTTTLNENDIGREPSNDIMTPQLTRIQAFMRFPKRVQI